MIKGTAHRQHGVSLIEAMVALAITALGLLTFVGLHLTVRANADLAKQRSEAVRIAQQDLENIRVFRMTGVPTTDAKFIDQVLSAVNNADRSLAVSQTTNGVTSVYTGNASYTLTRSVSTPAGADYSEVRVQVTWTDRQNQTQQVVLRNIIGRTDPATVAGLFIKPNGSPVRDTLGRDVQVPIPAKNLGDGRSVFKPNSGGNVAVVFDNDTGLVTETCGVDTSKRTAQITTGDLSACNSTDGYLISGFIRFKNGSFNNNFQGDGANDSPPLNSSWSPVLNFSGATAPSGGVGTFAMLTSTGWLSPSPGSYPAPVCGSESLKTISYTALVNLSQENNGTLTQTTESRFVLPVPADLSLTAANIAPYAGRLASEIRTFQDEGERYVAYTCVVYPIDLSSPADGLLEWSGRLTLQATGATIGTASSEYKVCRFSQDYNRNGYVWFPNIVPSTAPTQTVTKIDNEEHPYAYLMVNRSLSNQNFLVIQGNQSCPTDSSVEINGTGNENYTDATTVTHQP